MPYIGRCGSAACSAPTDTRAPLPDDLFEPDSLVTTDFTLDTVFFKRLYVLFFLPLARRRAVAAISTTEQDGTWVTQPARNLNAQVQDEGWELKVLIHDRDRKYCPSVDAVLAADGVPCN